MCYATPTFRAFITKLSVEQIPTRASEALSNPEWKRVTIEKMEALEKNGASVPTHLPERKHIVGCRWVFTIKHNPDNSIQ